MFVNICYHNPMHKNLDYKLIDTGDKRKLESYAGYVMDRPDPQALWPKSLSKEWDKVDARFDEDKGGKRDERGTWKAFKKRYPFFRRRMK